MYRSQRYVTQVKYDLSEEAAVETRLDGVTNWRTAVIPGNKQLKSQNNNNFRKNKNTSKYCPNLGPQPLFRPAEASHAVRGNRAYPA